MAIDNRVSNGLRKILTRYKYRKCITLIYASYMYMMKLNKIHKFTLELPMIIVRNLYRRNGGESF